jgi:hypothetical protein
MARCPRCNTSFREPPDEVGDHDCPRCGFARPCNGFGRNNDRLRQDIRDYVRSGGWDAFSFALLASPRYDHVPGREIQRLIDEEREALVNGND